MVSNGIFRNIIKIIIFCFIIICSKGLLFAQNGKETSIRATYYHDKFEKRKTSSGEVFSQKLYTAAHKTLPFHTIVKVTNKRTGKSVLVKINDRCGRNGILDLSKAAAKKIMLNGTETVQLKVLGKEYLDIWEQQNTLFEDSLLSDVAVADKIDSLITDKQNFGPYAYYIRVATVDGYINAKAVVDKIPTKYQNMTKVEKVYNENFYYVNIGPFQTQNIASSVINELKNVAPFSHLIKIRDK